jgi:hypothetical protein
MTRAQTRPKAGESLPRAQDIEQPDLFGTQRPSRLRAVARSTDPETSHTAAKRAQRSISLKQLAVLDCMRDYTRHFLPRIHDEKLIFQYAVRVTWWPIQSDSGIRTRRSELVRLGYVRDSKQRAIMQSGSASIEWELTDKGEAVDIDAFRRTLEAKAATRKQHRGKKRAGDLAP